MLIPALMLFVLLVMILLFNCADFHFTCCCSVYEFVGEVLKFTIAAVHKIDVVGKSKVAYGPATNGDGCVVAMECFLHDLL